MSQHPQDERFVELVHLVKAYPNPHGDPINVVEDVNLKIRKGEVISIIGHSGCGKSTVLTMVAGLNPITSGGIVVDNREITGPGPDRAVVFQSPCLLPWMTAYQNVMLGVQNVYPHATKQERKEIVEYYLHLVGLGESMHKYPRELSNGMQQRVGIARAVALQPKVLLLDEPFGMLDSLTRMELQQILLGLLDKTQATAMMVTHDVDEALLVADRVVMMTTGPRANIGEIVETPFARPRDRDAVLEHPDFYPLRGRLIQFLEDEGHRRDAAAAKARSERDGQTVSAVEEEQVVGVEEVAEASAEAAPMPTTPLGETLDQVHSEQHVSS
ncbi:Nitrate transport ATP-binding subunits C and D [Planctomycetales bacterium 10988]|nr:Nitrate transport ATP-binding subunits C and D [Planctomycetales bacterium 10988]